MKTKLCKNIFFIALLFVAGCGNEDLPQYTKLDRLRVLAIKADPPEVQNPPSGVVSVDILPYLSDVSGSGNLTLTIQSCLDPGASLGAAPTCEGATLASTPQTVSVAAPTGQVDGIFGSPERTGAPSAAISVNFIDPAAALSVASASARNNGVPYLITVTVNSSSGSIRAFRRILFSTKPINNNPVLADLLSQGASLTTRPTSDVDLSFTATGSPETYDVLGTDGVTRPETEVYETTWFISDGEILNPRTKAGETTKWSAGSAPQGRKTVVSGVLRDGRGGVSVIIRTLN